MSSVQRVLSEYLDQSSGTTFFGGIKPENCSAGRKLVAPNPQEIARTVRAILIRLAFWKHVEKKQRVELDPDRHVFNLAELMRHVKANLTGTRPEIRANKSNLEEYVYPFALRPLVSDLLRAAPPLTPDDVAALIDLASGQEKTAVGCVARRRSPAAVERHAAESGYLPRSATSSISGALQFRAGDRS